MARTDEVAPNGATRILRKVYNPLGFSKGYNALLWFIFDGALFGFALARAAYFDFSGTYCSPGPGKKQLHAAPGECYEYLNFKRYNVGIQMHLYTIIPMSLLVVLQFIPVIRYRAILYHRMAGYVVMLLLLICNASALMIADRAFGGSAATQMWVGALALMTTVGFLLALWNIKKLQVDQHRAWMLRTWVWAGSIITVRIIMVIAAAIQANWPYEQLHIAVDCDRIVNIYGGDTSRAYSKYPACDPSNAAATPSDANVGVAYTVVAANFMAKDPVQIATALYAFFGAAGWLALAIHAAAIEIYLKLTPAENHRLRVVSYEKQLERGWADAGYSGLVVEKLGDAAGVEWLPPSSKGKHGDYDDEGDASALQHRRAKHSDDTVASVDRSPVKTIVDDADAPVTNK